MAKGFIGEFKEFVMRGNVMDMAVGVIIGGAFSSIVTALTDSFINPLIAVCTGGTGEDGVQIGGQFMVNGVAFNYGSFLSAVINFLIIAFILFCMMKAVNKAMSIGKKPAPIAAPTTKKCPFCKSEIAIEATRCPHCTSQLEEK
ncbi:MAG: large conductance mechanosensitive channel protein MscL [Lachnospiraceae bacterium]|nr:large conductance mechanosensitive channel protein MscL [Lachnospiraceae bacterium]MBQ8118642.1 large conductance mechanosensitive channel protein MscL [Lachnospiraceae bacterium]